MEEVKIGIDFVWVHVLEIGDFQNRGEMKGQ
jgi:hypothetical protein